MCEIDICKSWFADTFVFFIKKRKEISLNRNEFKTFTFNLDNFWPLYQGISLA